ncbi:hypothetical protein CXG81DRAFT_20445 [Caulochytrium protostelioides]|uniref:Putative ER lumen protein retaining receptor C28H8.4 n=1 Tax=Caulochytrium protostelioides TaxID=1555241 RepID=A0A4V1IU65_9FUNG|nr:putative ER lumen protein retaining receptor C28H8.4 [Caulochytrium protostelioides]RKO99478.1 hypothetical protein CXG81DRAFT_20445 [Caulochytrium protostelioides]|eukprot:RKO99478.1 hypothetical protein CXG81DRAFT_20445 [Caulochytrium protostelioides]
MNGFRLIADLLHLLSYLLLLLKIYTSRSAAGISQKTQFLYLLVFATRYLDLFVVFRSLYNSGMKIVFLACSGYVTYKMQVPPLNATWDREADRFPILYLIVPAAVLSLLFHYDWSLFELLWTFSEYLEAGAILPQLLLLQRTGEASTLTSHYIMALGAYRGFYIINWIYRFVVEGHFDPISAISGIIQTGLYADFFYIYFKKVVQGGQRFQLPA